MLFFHPHHYDLLVVDRIFISGEQHISRMITENINHLVTFRRTVQWHVANNYLDPCIIFLPETIYLSSYTW